MSMKMKETVYGAPSKQILAIPDNYVAFGAIHPQATETDPKLAVIEGGRYIVKAGTIYPSNDDKAIGVVLNDYDVTDGDQMMAVVEFGFIKEAALPVPVTEDAKKALTLIRFKGDAVYHLV